MLMSFVGFGGDEEERHFNETLANMSDLVAMRPLTHAEFQSLTRAFGALPRQTRQDWITRASSLSGFQNHLALAWNSAAIGSGTIGLTERGWSYYQQAINNRN